MTQGDREVMVGVSTNLHTPVHTDALRGQQHLQHQLGASSQLGPCLLQTLHCYAEVWVVPWLQSVEVPVLYCH